MSGPYAMLESRRGFPAVLRLPGREGRAVLPPDIQAAVEAVEAAEQDVAAANGRVGRSWQLVQDGKARDLAEAADALAAGKAPGPGQHEREAIESNAEAARVLEARRQLLLRAQRALVDVVRAAGLDVLSELATAVGKATKLCAEQLDAAQGAVRRRCELDAVTTWINLILADRPVVKQLDGTRAAAQYQQEFDRIRLAVSPKRTTTVALPVNVAASQLVTP